MKSNKDILAAISATLGIESLNTMQQTVADSTASRIVLLAPTGSGKTLAFAIPLLRSLNPDHRATVQALVLAPSRELVMQIADIIRPLALPFKTLAFYGGHPMQDEVNSLNVVPEVIVATPGRLVDHLQRVTVDISSVKTLVLDEYDKMLDLGFHDQMRRIVRRVEHPRTVILTSATPLAEMPAFVDMKGARTYDFSANASAARPRLMVMDVESPSRDKLDTLVDLLRSLPEGKAIVFVNHRESAERVYNRLSKEHLPVGLYHGGLEQREREIAIDKLNNATTPILVATDLGARGLDIDNVSYVVHYHIAPSEESYTHRNGRTGRQGTDGQVYVVRSEADNLPPYVTVDHSYRPTLQVERPIKSTTATIYFPAGRKEKLSAGDIVGFLTKQAGLEGSQIGKINVRDHYALAAVPRSATPAVMGAAATEKIKGKKLKLSVLK